MAGTGELKIDTSPTWDWRVCDIVLGFWLLFLSTSKLFTLCHLSVENQQFFTHTVDHDWWDSFIEFSSSFPSFSIERTEQTNMLSGRLLHWPVNNCLTLSGWLHKGGILNSRSLALVCQQGQMSSSEYLVVKTSGYTVLDYWPRMLYIAPYISQSLKRFEIFQVFII